MHLFQHKRLLCMEFVIILLAVSAAGIRAVDDTNPQGNPEAGAAEQQPMKDVRQMWHRGPDFGQYVEHKKKWGSLTPGQHGKAVFEGECTAQPADFFVDNVFVMGGSFKWTDLPAVDVYPKTTPCCWAQSLSPDAREDEVRRRSRRRSNKTTTPHGAPSSAPTASVAAATSPMEVSGTIFQRPVSSTASDVGFLGTYDTTARPSDEALVVAPHPSLKGFNYVVHAIKRKMAIFIATEHGKYVGTASPGAVSFSTLLAQTGQDPTQYFVTDPVGFYDLKENRYVFVMMTYLRNEAPVAPGPYFLLLVSDTDDPTGTWSAKAILSNLPQSTGLYCADTYYFTPDYPQMTYDTSGVYLTVGLYCGDGPDAETWKGGILWAYPKRALYASGSGKIKAAIYVATGSVQEAAGAPLTQQIFMQPAVPQSPADVHSNPLFVINQRSTNMVVVNLADTHKLDKMTSTSGSPRVQALVVPFGFTFTDGVTLQDLPQFNTDFVLDGGDTDFRISAATKHGDTLYVATVKYYGSGPPYVPAIYYAFLCLGEDMNVCRVDRQAAGLLAANQNAGRLGLSYPNIAALPGGGAVLMYAFSGNGYLPGGLGPAYAGVATSTVSPQGEIGMIDLVNVGDGVVTLGCDQDADANWCRWGDYTAISVVHDRVWFATPRAQQVISQNSTWIGTWISSYLLETPYY